VKCCAERVPRLKVRTSLLRVDLLTRIARSPLPERFAIYPRAPHGVFAGQRGLAWRQATGPTFAKATAWQAEVGGYRSEVRITGFVSSKTCLSPGPNSRRTNSCVESRRFRSMPT
jgi:hypothetical protein